MYDYAQNIDSKENKENQNIIPPFYTLSNFVFSDSTKSFPSPIDFWYSFPALI